MTTGPIAQHLSSTPRSFSIALSTTPLFLPSFTIARPPTTFVTAQHAEEILTGWSPLSYRRSHCQTRCECSKCRKKPQGHNYVHPRTAAEHAIVHKSPPMKTLKLPRPWDREIKVPTAKRARARLDDPLQAVGHGTASQNRTPGQIGVGGSSSGTGEEISSGFRRHMTYTDEFRAVASDAAPPTHNPSKEYDPAEQVQAYKARRCRKPPPRQGEGPEGSQLAPGKPQQLNPSLRHTQRLTDPRSSCGSTLSLSMQETSRSRKEHTLFLTIFQRTSCQYRVCGASEPSKSCA